MHSSTQIIHSGFYAVLEPILQWKLGTLVQSPSASYLDFTDFYHVAQSPCVADVALIAPAYNVPLPGNVVCYVLHLLFK